MQLRFWLFCTFVFFLLLFVTTSYDVQAGGTYQPPRTGFEDPEKPRTRPVRVPSSIPDAYGNPIFPIEKEKPKKERLPAGAYGKYGRDAVERPLPKEQDSRPLW